MNRRLIKRKLSDMVIKEIGSFIIDSGYKPGDKLPSTKEIAKLFGISYSTLREALEKLQVLGVIEMKQGRGIFLKKDSFDVFLVNPAIELLDKDILNDLIYARKVIEVENVRLTVRNAQRKDLETLKGLLSKMKENLNNMKEFIKYNIMFHLVMGKASNNKIFYQIIAGITDLIREEEKAIFKKQPKLTQDGYAQHRDIYTAIEEQDEDRAVKSMRNHMEKVEKMITYCLVDKKDKGNE